MLWLLFSNIWAKIGLLFIKPFGHTEHNMIYWRSDFITRTTEQFLSHLDRLKHLSKIESLLCYLWSPGSRFYQRNTETTRSLLRIRTKPRIEGKLLTFFITRPNLQVTLNSNLQSLPWILKKLIFTWLGKSTLGELVRFLKITDDLII